VRFNALASLAVWGFWCAPGLTTRWLFQDYLGEEASWSIHRINGGVALQWPPPDAVLDTVRCYVTSEGGGRLWHKRCYNPSTSHLQFTLFSVRYRSRGREEINARLPQSPNSVLASLTSPWPAAPEQLDPVCNAGACTYPTVGTYAAHGSMAVMFDNDWLAAKELSVPVAWSPFTSVIQRLQVAPNA
jgi:hypothetical protein